MIRVGINGYGTIGKRVADAVAAQDDMKIVGVTKTRPNFAQRWPPKDMTYTLLSQSTSINSRSAG